ncbi:MAG TPA: phenylacetate--CoA ligase [Candidatus Omnitrophota bacterium]|nr:phenylacetate--CoA ligase [Candidatus Omnitrophota bacterium]HPS20880.1 phenylacetate--CoA ligase [Candidatus Omnitrophota bacterium]
MNLFAKKEINFRDKDIETIGREELSDMQFASFMSTMRAALRTEFYKNRFAKIGITSREDIKSLDDLAKIPFTTKEDLREAYPSGLLAVGLEKVVRLHTSSGTTGSPTVIYHTQKDLDNWTELLMRGLTACGVTEKDVFQNMMTYGLFTGGLGLHYAAERLGALVIPAGSGNTRRQMQLMKDFRTTAVHVTPNYMLHIAGRIEELGFKLEELNLKKAFLGAEPFSENARKKIEKSFKIDVYNCYGLSEMNGPGVAMECVYKDGLHIWEDSYIVEIIDPATGKVLPDGQQGELVLTTLKREATPLLRYRTRDLATVFKGNCPCGRTHRRISRIMGRTDDMLIINGVNIFPSQIEEVLMKKPEVGTNYLIELNKRDELDRITIKVEIYAKLFHGSMKELEELRDQLKDELKSTMLVSADVEIHEPGSLPVYEGKAKRVIDNRSKE